MTRVDIAFVIQVLSQFMHKPKQSNMEAAQRVVRYIKVAPGLGLLMPAQGSDKLQAFLSWKSKKQDTVARSSAKAEFRSMASTVTELTWQGCTRS
ncbi:PREDICTED: uncharacterized protein LOC109220599 [Nicotiana attenuata]|uniref:uncharacterized protein LOC109220599 n=1 Tax=Nicotiana attenuata TaxID=49451 RepID=UPI0009057F1D|nr:PREDICTED: uncharacterized protein LOC109220599 [Nicotiana attenuata]